MRAIVCREFGALGQLRCEEWPRPTARPGEAIVAVDFAAVNLPDLLLIRNKYQFPAVPPFVPGCELSGVVVSTASDVQSVRVGTRVMAFPHRGAYAEEVALSANLLLRVPDEMAMDTAAAFPLAYATAGHALRGIGGLRAKERVLVLGAGGSIGLAMVEIAKRLDAYVIAVASSDAKLEACRERGADVLINRRTRDLRTEVLELLGEQRLDLVCDSVGGELAEVALRLLGWRGRFVVIGFASGQIPRIPLNLLVLKNCSVSGFLIGQVMARDPTMFSREFDESLRWAQSGALRPAIESIYPLEKASSALTRLATGDVVGKLLLRVRQ